MAWVFVGLIRQEQVCYPYLTLPYLWVFCTLFKTPSVFPSAGCDQPKNNESNCLAYALAKGFIDLTNVHLAHLQLQAWLQQACQ